jgi:MFS transporter, DHA3 family, multidrug efflux protein
VPAADGSSSRIDVRGALESIRAVPGLMLLVLLAAFNNLLGGVFMALMDAYGLSIVSVQTWGLLFGVVSWAFIVGGLVVAKVGLGSRPARIVLAGNLVNWIVCATFALRSSIVLLGIGMLVWLLMIPVIEAAEQTRGWFGTGPKRGLALIFTLAGLIGVVVTIGVRLSRSYRRLDVATPVAA